MWTLFAIAAKLVMAATVALGFAHYHPTTDKEHTRPRPNQTQAAWPVAILTNCIWRGDDEGVADEEMLASDNHSSSRASDGPA
jgi:hypothetical protein